MVKLDELLARTESEQNVKNNNISPEPCWQSKERSNWFGSRLMKQQLDVKVDGHLRGIIHAETIHTPNNPKILERDLKTIIYQVAETIKRL